jgi:hypothetical protein
VGESGHFFDLMAYLTHSRPTRVHASVLRPAKAIKDDLENFHVSIQFENGSIGSLMYLTQGGARVPKEYVEVFAAGCTAQLHDFEELRFYEGHKVRKARVPRDRGHACELESFIDAVRTGGPMPIPIEALFDATLVTLASVCSVETASVIDIDSARMLEPE